MKIKIIKPIAHCFGVVNAINLAKKVNDEMVIYINNKSEIKKKKKFKNKKKKE